MVAWLEDEQGKQQDALDDYDSDSSDKKNKRKRKGYRFEAD